jgi:antiviral helicase SKI2
MAAGLADRLQELQLDGKTIDDILFERPSQKRARREPDEVKAELEAKYLSPSPTFSAAWLNRLQQYIPRRHPDQNSS